MARWKMMRVLVGVLMSVILLAGGYAAGLSVTPAAGSAKDVTPSPQLEIQPLAPAYEVVPLETEYVTACAIQHHPVAIDPNHPAPAIKENLDNMIRVMEGTYHAMFGGHKHLMVFEEFPLCGYDNTWTREEWLRIAIEVPNGKEVKAIGEWAKEHGTYVFFGTHFQEPDEWPGHFFNGCILIGPTGEIILKHWKAYSGFPGLGLEYATTVHDVLDEFLERYGWDAVWPVARTPIGNLAGYVCSEGFVPETARSYAYQGAEILCRIFGGGGYGGGETHRTRFQMDCSFNSCWGVYSNSGSGVTINRVQRPANSRGGGSFICDNKGNILIEAADFSEQAIIYRIPIAEFRKTHKIPNIRTEIYVPIAEHNPGRYPPNLYTLYQQEHNGELPPTPEAAREWTLQHER
ncbi:nitrilase-related carbon-nitrogen hydrolase [Chloroflexota bacterium]